MEEFLKYTKTELAHLSSFDTVHVVMGNESCDLDSAVASITYAYYLHKINLSTSTLYLPLLNIPVNQFRLRTEVTHFFQKVGIGFDLLTFRDQISLKVIRGEGRLTLTLVDHNVLPSDDRELEDCVVTVLDHHLRERPDSDRVRVVLDLVGSCCTLVAEELLDDTDFSLNHQVALLLYGTILVDTINKSAQAGKITPRDDTVLSRLKELPILQDVKGDELFQEIQAAKFDISGLTNMELLEKDLKIVTSDTMVIAMASVTMDMKDLLQRPDFAGDLVTFSRSRSADVVVLMTLTTDDSGSSERQLAVFSENRIFKQQVADILDVAENPHLDLDPMSPPFETIAVFSQGNVTASRKKVMPILKSFLHGAKTPELSNKELVSETQKNNSAVVEGFSSLVELNQPISEGCSLNRGDSNEQQKSHDQSRNLRDFDPFSELNRNGMEENPKYETQTQLNQALLEFDDSQAAGQRTDLQTQPVNPFMDLSTFTANTQNPDEIAAVDFPEIPNIPTASNPFTDTSSTEDFQNLDPFQTVQQNSVLGTNPFIIDQSELQQNASPGTSQSESALQQEGAQGTNSFQTKQSDFWLQQDTKSSTADHTSNAFPENPILPETKKDPWPLQVEGSVPKNKNPSKLSVTISDVDKLGELYEADLFEKLNTPDITNSGISSPVINSGISTPKELGSGHVSGRGSESGSGYPSVTQTPPNSLMDGGLENERRDYNLPSFNSSEMVERIKRKKEKLGGSQDQDLLTPDLPDQSSTPFTPQNSFRDDNLDSVFKDRSLPSFNSSDMVKKIAEKRSSLTAAFEASDNLLVENKPNLVQENSNTLDIFLNSSSDNQDDSKTVPFTPQNSFINASFDQLARENLPSLNNAETVRKVHEKQTALFSLEENRSHDQSHDSANNDVLLNFDLTVQKQDIPQNARETGILSQNQFLSREDFVPFTPQNSYVTEGGRFFENRGSITEQELQKKLSVIQASQDEEQNYGAESKADIFSDLLGLQSDNADSYTSMSQFPSDSRPDSSQGPISSDVNISDHFLSVDQESCDAELSQTVSTNDGVIGEPHDRSQSGQNFFANLAANQSPNIAQNTEVENANDESGKNVKSVDLEICVNEVNSLVAVGGEEDVSEIAESLAREIINNAVEKFPDFQNPALKEELLKEGSFIPQELSGDFGIDQSKGAFYSKQDFRVPGSRTRKTSEVALETDYLPNMDPLRGNLNIVTSPTSSTIETDADKEVVEGMSFRKVSDEASDSMRIEILSHCSKLEQNPESVIAEEQLVESDDQKFVVEDTTDVVKSKDCDEDEEEDKTVKSNAVFVEMSQKSVTKGRQETTPLPLDAVTDLVDNRSERVDDGNSSKPEEFGRDLVTVTKATVLSEENCMEDQKTAMFQEIFDGEENDEGGYKTFKENLDDQALHIDPREDALDQQVDRNLLKGFQQNKDLMEKLDDKVELGNANVESLLENKAEIVKNIVEVSGSLTGREEEERNGDEKEDSDNGSISSDLSSSFATTESTKTDDEEDENDDDDFIRGSVSMEENVFETDLSQSETERQGTYDVNLDRVISSVSSADSPSETSTSGMYEINQDTSQSEVGVQDIQNISETVGESGASIETISPIDTPTDSSVSEQYDINPVVSETLRRSLETEDRFSPADTPESDNVSNMNKLQSINLETSIEAVNDFSKVDSSPDEQGLLKDSIGEKKILDLAESLVTSAMSSAIETAHHIQAEDEQRIVMEIEDAMKDTFSPSDTDESDASSTTTEGSYRINESETEGVDKMGENSPNSPLEQDVEQNLIVETLTEDIETVETSEGRKTASGDNSAGAIPKGSHADQTGKGDNSQYFEVSRPGYRTRKEVFMTSAGRMSISIDSVIDPPGDQDEIRVNQEHETIPEEFQPPDDQDFTQPENVEKPSQEPSASQRNGRTKMKGMDLTEEWHEDPIPGMEAEPESEEEESSSESDSESDGDEKPVRPNTLLTGQKKKQIIGTNSNGVANDGIDDGTDDIPTPDDLEGEGELEWESMYDTPVLTPAMTPSESIHEFSEEEEKAENRQYRKVEIAGKEYRVDMQVIEPYKKVLSHGGYYGDGLNAIILFSGCYLPDRGRRDYQYVMDNLFLYVISTLELLVAEDYLIVYFHGATPRRQMPSFGWLKRCYQMIDRRLRKNLKSLLLVHPTLWLKTIVMMTKPFISSKFSSKLRFVKTIQELGRIVPMEYIYVPEPVQQYDDRLVRHNSSKTSSTPSSSDNPSPR